MKMLLAADGSPYTKRMLAYLVTHDDWAAMSNSYTVFHGVPALPPRAAAFATVQQMRAYYEEDAEAVFRPIRKFLERHGVAARYVYKVGRPAQALARLADKERFDLLMMGSRGHGSLTNLVLGSVATKVLARCSTPVLLIR